MRRIVILIAAAVMITASTLKCCAQSTATDADRLHQAFLDPPRDFSPMPFWFWNGKMEGPVIQQEIRDMADQHVYGAFLHARDGLQTPYLSEAWFDAIGAGLEQAKKSGFEFNFVDEYDWPSGEVRNIWMAANHQSEILARQPDLRMKTLAFDTKLVDGPREVEVDEDPESQAVVAARWLGENRIDGASLTLIDSGAKPGPLRWTVPEGKWVIVQFHLRPAMGFDGGFTDLMNPQTTSLFFNLVYGEYHRRFPSSFGDTIHYSFSDHEGDYGYRIAWTPQLFSAFERRAGYDLRKMLPLLIYDGGDITTKLRADYLSTITELYGDTFWQGITKSAAGLGIGRTGHAWEESLQWATALEGSLFTVERGLNPVGVDSLVDFGRQPLNFKVAQSVADFEGRRFACENQGVQGTDSWLDLEGMRKATNAIGAWGVNLFIPHAFDYDAGRANYPPDWLHQPFWPYFHTYADYTRRISYMNADSRHVTDILLYYPITSMWADSAPVFSGSAPYQQIGKPTAWKNQTILLNDYYTRIILALSSAQRDYNVADDQYIDRAHIEGNELVIGPQHFRAVILPPTTTLSRTTLKKLEEFHQAGGIIFGIRLLPTASTETGGNDPVIEDGIRSIFGQPGGSQGPGTGSDAKPHGESFFVDDSVDDLITTLDAHLRRDVHVTSGPAEHLFFEHRNKSLTDYYWVVNDTDRPRVNEVHLAARGIPEKWDALTGAIEPLFYTNDADGTDVRLKLSPWDAFFVVFRPRAGAVQQAVLESTNADDVSELTRQGGNISAHVFGPATSAETYVELRSNGKRYRGEAGGGNAQPLILDGDWQFKPEPDQISVPYARVRDASEAQGISLGWTSPGFDDSDWSELWLSEEQNTLRNWDLIGPFPNSDNDGFAKVYPPEQNFDPKTKYDGLSGQVAWQEYYGNEPHLALQDWDIWMKTEGGSPSNSGYIVNLAPELLTDGEDWIVSYAHTYLYSPRDQHAQFVVAADNWAGVWLNHKRVFAELRTPFWYELNDNWADRFGVDLHKGWNEVLVKIGKARGTASGYYGFTFRVADDRGTTLRGVIASVNRETPGGSDEADKRMRFYRMAVPPGCVAIVPPALHQPYRILLNGQVLHSAGSAPIDLRGKLKGETNTLVLIAGSDDPLVSPVRFVTGDTPFSLKPWTMTGLANFSGTAIYTRTFTVPENFRDRRIMLDLGRVSSAADVFVNGDHAGLLVWRPYRLEISRFIRPGKNEIRIVVTDTEANQRAVGTWRDIRGAIDVCGLEGPVRLIPYIDQRITLRPLATQSDRQQPRRFRQRPINVRVPVPGRSVEVPL